MLREWRGSRRTERDRPHHDGRFTVASGEPSYARRSSERLAVAKDHFARRKSERIVKATLRARSRLFLRLTAGEASNHQGPEYDRAVNRLDPERRNLGERQEIADDPQQEHAG